MFDCFPNAVCVLPFSWLHFDHIVFPSGSLDPLSLDVRGRASRTSSASVCVEASTALGGRAPSQAFGIAFVFGASFEDALELAFAVAAAFEDAPVAASLELDTSKGELRKSRGRASERE